jgi:hypothetical protein
MFGNKSKPYNKENIFEAYSQLDKYEVNASSSKGSNLYSTLEELIRNNTE